MHYDHVDSLFGWTVSRIPVETHTITKNCFNNFNNKTLGLSLGHLQLWDSLRAPSTAFKECFLLAFGSGLNITRWSNLIFKFGQSLSWYGGSVVVVLYCGW